jgi:hypothetical protein
MVDKAAVAIAATSMVFLLCMVAYLLFEECSSNVSGQPRVPWPGNPPQDRHEDRRARPALERVFSGGSSGGTWLFHSEKLDISLKMAAPVEAHAALRRTNRGGGAL